MRQRISVQRRRTLVQLAAELRQHSPALRVANARTAPGQRAREHRDDHARRRVEQLGKRLAVAARTLDAVSPLATLSAAMRSSPIEGHGRHGCQDVRAGQLIDARLTQGSIRARIERTTNPELDLRLPGVDEK